ncbi:4Fe-4S ferredoxin, iron-sulfur binding [Quillaja saponaria]|uniref:4Fe-4S ferredoxin, iron-sulfur binding n=1 Tax=Quillaja saponaria TaxID=32244 RepID=A0AAD7LBS4_QUISA|nr:4Fe-4S ferredoxin, iron-sulfur binding [Quillaja saponaria]
MALRFLCNAKISPPHHVKVNLRSKKCLQNVKNLVKSVGVPSISSSPIESLQRGNWVKLICGASFEDVVDIRNLSLVYTLAGVDCIDCAADASVVSAVNEGIEAAREIVYLRRPWVMISVNDDKDLHFRKAEFDPEDCPVDCSRPCENVCPANAILFKGKSTLEASHGTTDKPRVLKGGVVTERCYGCGRCFPVCPYDKIREVTYVRDASTTADLIKRNDVDALEIHTSGRQTTFFNELWDALGDSVGYLRLIAVSLPDGGNSIITSMKEIFSIMKPRLRCSNLWQLDGRPMSGDIGRGATKASIAFAVRLAAAEDRPPGFLQLAGGTNAQTVDGLKKEGLFQTSTENLNGESSRTCSHSSSHALVGGIAYGGYARKIVGRVLRSMQFKHGGAALIEEYPEPLLEAVQEALTLVGTVKYHNL